MLTIYRRHTENCGYRSGGPKYDPTDLKTINSKCGCPIWVDGKHHGKRCRRSLDTRSQEDAARKVLELTAGAISIAAKDVTVAIAVQDYIDLTKRRGLTEGTINRYGKELAAVEQFCVKEGVASVRALDYATLKNFIATLEVAPSTLSTKVDTLHAFLGHCCAMGWCTINSAEATLKSKIRHTQVIPFTEGQHLLILAAINVYPTFNTHNYDNRARVLAFILVLRSTGLRIQDIVKLRPQDVNSAGTLLLWTTKTNTQVRMPLKPDVLAALAAIQDGSKHFFWTGRGKIKTAVNSWERSWDTLLKLAGIEGHPHMYRHMMAIELLTKSVSITDVAAILGITVATLLKYYSAWVASRQEALELAVKKTWDTPGNHALGMESVTQN